MKASHRAIARLLPLSGALLAVACVPAPEPTPAPTQTPVQTAPAPAPTPTPAPMPAPENWMDAPRTPGNWTYSVASGRTQAAYRTPAGAEQFNMICDTGNRTITLVRATTGSGQIPMQILTETTRRTLNATVSGSGSPMLAVQLQARDPLLDAMALTKGRFAIETPGQPTLYLPSWAEVSRVIEDCR